MHAKLLSGGQDDATHNRLGTAGLEGTGGTGRPGCGAGGQRRSLADNESTYHHTKHLRRRRSGGHRRDRKAGPRCRWAAAGPGRASPSDTSAAGLEGTGGTGRPGCSAGGRRRGLAGQRVDAPSEARSADGGRAAAHGHTKQPRPTRAHQAARPHNRVLHRPEHQRRHQHRRNTSGATHHRGIAKPPGPAGAGRLSQYQRIIEEPRQCRDYRDRFPGARSRCRASMRCPWRYLPCGDPHRRRWRPEWSSRRRSRRWSPRIRLGSGSGPAGWRTPECRCR